MGLDDRIYEWQRATGDDTEYARILEHLYYLSDHLFHQYKPTRGAKKFVDRLADWLDSSAIEADQKLLFQFTQLLLFVGQAELDSLYQAAFDGPIARWLIDTTGIQLNSPKAKDVLQLAVTRTWFCELTDSGRIYDFYKLNDITGNHLRPSWMALEKLSTRSKIQEYMTKKNLERIVLIEDFVGSGGQVRKIVEFAAGLPSTPPILICPIIICPKGVENLSSFAANNDHVTFDPVFKVSERSLLLPKPHDDEPAIFLKIRELINRLYDTVKGKTPQHLYGAFGYKDTGALTIMHTNCPDNVPPIVHHSSDTWSPLFRRASRI